MTKEITDRRERKGNKGKERNRKIEREKARKKE
jgi:hypothetical protein